MVGAGEETSIEKSDDPTIGGRAQQPPGGLNHPRHSRNDEGVLEASLEALVVVELEELALEVVLGEPGRNDDHL